MVRVEPDARCVMDEWMETNAPDLGAGNSFYVTPDRGGDQMLRGQAAARFSGRIKNRAADRVVSDAGLPARLLIRGTPRRSRTPGRRR